MPQRINQKSDIGTAKNASDSYDADNIYLSEEGWVYRHYKNSAMTKWWDEIIVAGQVDPATNADTTETNPEVLGHPSVSVALETGDGHADIEYAGHYPDYDDKVVIDSADKTYENGSYRVPAYATEAGGGTTPSPTPTPTPTPDPDPIIPPSPAATNPQTPETGPLAIDGYYPLYNTEAGANSSGGGAHSHVFNGVTYYMPNTGTYYHGNYNTGGGSGY